ncbi:putative F-box protein At1g50870 isoform X3 [Quercus robur]|uniref:putative F-box protein At1g50870 isoform X3 n=1 Tax=Quercus robur TaxID=38942 RepID=UPI002162F4B3|nr:putative F-box protein At1g50870 isoform X3 [Quercus robur]
MFTTNEVLPEDLIIQILLWLPVVSLLRFKCVCKSWCALINGQNFINKHLLHNQTTSNKNRNAGFLLIQRQKSSNDHVFSKLQYESLEILSTQAVPSPYIGIPKHIQINIVSSINGLVCLNLNAGNTDIVLWNPATNETKVLPKSSISYPQAEVYCLSTGSWRTVSTSAPGYFMDSGCYRTYTKGMFSWSASIRDDLDFFPGILSFDMSNEVFLTTTLPDGDLEDPNGTWRIFFVLNELVSLVTFGKDRERLENCFYIWSLLEYGVKESWIKLFTIGPLMGIEEPLGFWKNESLFLRNNEGQLLLYDPSAQKITNHQVDGRPMQMITYVESLISLKGGNDLEEQGNS